uniref:Uncharacterized protein n=1 Tax=Pithovirus LCDPAC02 TaxID=2506601 RepID=A0A481YNP8_9VIRU|nr:MAG: hypothetical protein LCDPAC02_01110 [Pithovirus LCDPAC02]
MEIEYMNIYKHMIEYICEIYQAYGLHKYCNYNKLLYFDFSNIKQNKQSNYTLMDDNGNFLKMLICLTGKEVVLMHGTYDNSKYTGKGRIPYDCEEYINLSFNLTKSIINTYFDIFETYLKENGYLILYNLMGKRKTFAILEHNNKNTKNVYNSEYFPSNIELYKLNNLELTVFQEN